MKISQLFLSTLKETPAETEIISHKLMVRAGLIRKLSAGIYNWLPLGLRVIRKIEAIVREEMNRAAAAEVLMPSMHPAELWQESGRWDFYGPELLRIKDRHKRDFCYGPTHEEVITDLVRHDLRSYKQLPVILYQIQTKFRDEIRPRFGVMRSREFIMKDAYSFDNDQAAALLSYEKMYEAYCRIFERLGLRFRAVQADTGAIGGNRSHEFQVLADSGEDVILYSDQSEYAANRELTSCLPNKQVNPSNNALKEVATPGQYTIEAVSQFLKLPKEKTVKTLLVKGTEFPVIALVLRGDHELNPCKANKLPEIANPLVLVSEEEFKKTMHCNPGSIGPVGLSIPVIVDYAAAEVEDFCCGANKDDYHFINVNWGRDLSLPKTADLRFAEVGDPSPDGKGQLQSTRGIEVGHVFYLGTKYSQAMNATVLDDQGKAKIVEMGCYGIGISRIAAASIEQNHDEHGIIWPEAIAPFQVALVPINMYKSTKVKDVCEKLYSSLAKAGFDVLWDDRDVRPGSMFADMDLIGIPHRIVVGEKGLENNAIEYKHRRKDNMEMVVLDNVVNFLLTQV